MNEIEILRFGPENKELCKKALTIRTEVFVKGQGVDPLLEYEHEEESHNYLMLYESQPIATARWRETEKGIKLERFAVTRHWRHKLFGSRLLDEVLKDVVPFGKMVYLHSQLRAVPYYSRKGFVTDGEMFMEAGIEHFLMILKREAVI